MSNNQSSSSGMGLPGVLLVVFIVLKLTGVIAWSWFWVLSPLWITIIAVILVAFITYLITDH